ncbi:MAG: BPL-N domain-containing protein [Bacteroidota bacterium]
MNSLKYLILIVLMLAGACSQKSTETGKIKVGVYSGEGASAVCVIETIEALKIDRGVSPCAVSPGDIMEGKLNELDVLIFPGGSGSKELNSLGEQAADKVRTFSYEDGKGLVGICAGGFLLSTTPGYPSLQIFPEPDIRDGYYDRGRGLVSFNLNEKGKEIFPELASQDSLYVQYYDGPIFKYPESTSSNILGSFYSDVANREGYPEGTTPGKLMFSTSEYGKGKVFVSVGHPEATAGMRWMIPRMARWVSDNELVSYPEKLVRPEINNKEVLYFTEQVKYEKKNFWDLFDENDSVVINALINLHSIRSRPSIRWSVGLLRHNSPEVRLHAAKYLLETEYTDAIPDLELAMRHEKEQEQEMSEILLQLQNMVE